MPADHRFPAPVQGLALEGVPATHRARPISSGWRTGEVNTPVAIGSASGRHGGRRTPPAGATEAAITAIDGGKTAFKR